MADTSRPSPRSSFVGRWWRRFWWFVDATRRTLLNLLFLSLLVMLAWWLFKPGPPALRDKTALVLDLSGAMVEQTTGSARDGALKQLRGDDSDQMRLRDVLAVLDAAARDDKIAHVLLLLDDFDGAGQPTLREVAAAVRRVKAAGKPVYAWAANYSQRQYFVAAQATEVWLDPMGAVEMRGLGNLRNYYKEALDTVGLTAHVLRVGTFKNAAEAFTEDGPSPATQQADALLYDALWAGWTRDVESARKLPAGGVQAAIDALPGSLQAAGGDVGKLLLQQKFVDGLKTRDEVRALLVERGARDAAAKSFLQVSWRDYLARLRPKTGGDAVGVVVAQGEISDGIAPAGRIGGRSTGQLIRQAREDDAIKAVVLRVNSPGGSPLGSEQVRRELELTRKSGKPVVVSMGDVAASGGYWIALGADEMIADEATVTGSIGVVAVLPSAERALGKLGISTAGHTTTWLGRAYDPRTGLDPRFATLVQTNIDHVYADFTARAAVARRTTADKIDAVAQGRVWTGTQAQERGLVDRTGSFADAVRSAAARAKLPEGHAVRWIEREPGRLEQLFTVLRGSVFAALGVDGADLGAALQGPALAAGVPGAVARGIVADAAWLHDPASQRGVVHCLCVAP